MNIIVEREQPINLSLKSGNPIITVQKTNGVNATLENENVTFQLVRKPDIIVSFSAKIIGSTEGGSSDINLNNYYTRYQTDNKFVSKEELETTHYTKQETNDTFVKKEDLVEDIEPTINEIGTKVDAVEKTLQDDYYDKETINATFVKGEELAPTIQEINKAFAGVSTELNNRVTKEEADTTFTKKEDLPSEVNTITKPQFDQLLEKIDKDYYTKEQTDNLISEFGKGNIVCTQEAYDAIVNKENIFYMIKENDDLQKIYFGTTLVGQKKSDGSMGFPYTFPFKLA